MNYASISLQLVSPGHWSFETIIGKTYLPSSDETGYCDAACQPGFKCVLITDTQGLKSKQRRSPRTLAYMFRFCLFFLAVFLTVDFFFKKTA